MDIHSHHTDPRIEGAAPLYKDAQMILKTQRESNIDVNVLSDVMLFDYASKSNIERMKAIRMSHDYFMKFARDNAERFMFFAFAYPFGGEEAKKELLRALDDQYCKGIILNSNIDGKYPDEKEVRYVFDIATDRDVPLFIHPPRTTMGADKLDQYHLLSILGRPTDVTLAALRIILSGIMEEYKKLKVVLSYGGAALTMLKLRIDFQCDIPEHRAQPHYSPILTKQPSEYIRSMYLDTTTMSKEAIMNLINVVGADHVVLGTDFPPGTVHPRRYIQTINELPVSESAKKGILGGNAISLLKLKEQVLA